MVETGGELEETGVTLDQMACPERFALNRSGSSVGLGGLMALKSISGGSLFTLLCLAPFLRAGRDGCSSFIRNLVHILRWLLTVALFFLGLFSIRLTFVVLYNTLFCC